MFSDCDLSGTLMTELQTVPLTQGYLAARWTVAVPASCDCSSLLLGEVRGTLQLPGAVLLCIETVPVLLLLRVVIMCSYPIKLSASFPSKYPQSLQRLSVFLIIYFEEACLGIYCDVFSSCCVFWFLNLFILVLYFRYPV